MPISHTSSPALASMPSFSDKKQATVFCLNLNPRSVFSAASGLWKCFGRSKKEGKQKLPVAPAAEVNRELVTREGGGGSARAGKKWFSVSRDDYRLLEEVGNGATATVYRTVYLPTGETIAVKCLDLDRCNSNVDDIRREAQTMSLIDHANIIKAHCSFVVDRHLWVVMPFMEGGSCLHLMKLSHPDGFNEDTICSILKETLKALEYLHAQGHIHRDVKAGNILLDSSGMVKLGDFGVSACMFDNGDRQRSRNTFVGTPCWMAPEILQPGSGYDFKADIWSFGITALELAHGHAPFSKFPPMKVLLMTLQNAPPGLDYERDKKFSKSFKEMIAMCLVKDQTKRPTAEKLLKHSFFKNAKPPEFCVKSLLVDLAPLWDRVKALQLQDEAQLALKKMPSAEQEALSQSEYQRGVSAWNFDIEDLKAQASLIQDDDHLPDTKEDLGISNHFLSYKDPSTSSSLRKSPDVIEYSESDYHDMNSDTRSFSTHEALVDQELVDFGDQEKTGRLELQLKNDALRRHLLPTSGKDDTRRNPQTSIVPAIHVNLPSNLPFEKGQATERVDVDNQFMDERHKRDAFEGTKLGGPMMPSQLLSVNIQPAPIRSSGSYGDLLVDKSRHNVVQIKGRFSVTPGNVDLTKDVPLGSVSWQFPHQIMIPFSKEIGNTFVPSLLLMPYLQNLYQQTSFQKDLIMSLLNSFQQHNIIHSLHTGIPSHSYVAEKGFIADTNSSLERERFLLIKISELQARINDVIDELTAMKLKHYQLEQQISAKCCQ